MRSRAALAASGVAALSLGFGMMQIGIQRHAPAGHRESSQTILAASVPSFALPSSEDSARLVFAEEQREAERLETERLERVVREEREAAEREAREEEDRHLARAAAVRAEKVRKAAEAISTPTTVRAAPVARTPAPAETGSGACGGSLPPCSVMRAESGGNIRAVNSTGCSGRGCFGKWQFDPRTSAGLGYSLTMDQYDEATQDAAARTLWRDGAGCSHWNAC